MLPTWKNAVCGHDSNNAFPILFLTFHNTVLTYAFSSVQCVPEWTVGQGEW